MGSKHSPEYQAKKLQQAKEFLVRNPEASKKALMLHLGMGIAYVNKWVKEGHIKVKRLPPGANLRRHWVQR